MRENYKGSSLIGSTALRSWVVRWNRYMIVRRGASMGGRGGLPYPFVFAPPLHNPEQCTTYTHVRAGLVTCGCGGGGPIVLIAPNINTCLSRDTMLCSFCPRDRLLSVINAHFRARMRLRSSETKEINPLPFPSPSPLPYLGAYASPRYPRNLYHRRETGPGSCIIFSSPR